MGVSCVPGTVLGAWPVLHHDLPDTQQAQRLRAGFRGVEGRQRSQSALDVYCRTPRQIRGHSGSEMRGAALEVSCRGE